MIKVVHVIPLSRCSELMVAYLFNCVSLLYIYTCSNLNCILGQSLGHGQALLYPAVLLTSRLFMFTNVKYHRDIALMCISLIDTGMCSNLVKFIVYVLILWDELSIWKKKPF